MTPGDNKEPHDSCHHVDTTYGDDFGGCGTSREFREEEIPRRYRPLPALGMPVPRPKLHSVG